ncbi:DUF805 domain-containing protein [Enterococcus rivorum]|uniref:DUF805 domain-containing protein n=1 Tax=Enterococcus rivorum TaxID=762845 RepID=A0A1E5L019_9ENTE|nr:DUF805 domain-containing protein [Enterococcus rivorum]MBP2100169.1 uncharacterized membrane protein YhaH (DUF805 family) [Enterococcus rivorum]OEH83461.1 hypothetical protein BCR26_09580 [Enterococcus rivorum]
MKKISQEGKVSFPQAVKDFYQGYFDFTGNTTRSGYWWVILAIFIAYVVLFILTISVPLMAFIVLLFSLSLIVPLITLSVRRIRNTGLKSKTILALYILYYAFYGTFMMSFYSSLLNSLSSVYSDYSDSYVPIASMNFSGSALVALIFLALSLFISVCMFLPTDMFATKSNNSILTSIFSKKA